MAYIVIQDWMITELQLTGNELLVYALVYGFSQDGASEFKGSLKYISDFLGVSKKTAQRNLEKLEERGVIEKRTEEIRGVQFNRYIAYSQNDTPIVKMTTGYSQNDHGGIVKMTTGYSQNDHGGIVKMTTNNNNNNNNNNNKGARARYFEDDELNNKFLEFLDMRKKTRRPLRTDRGINAAVNKIRTLAGDDTELAKKIMDQSLDHEWGGFFALHTSNARAVNNINDRLYGDAQRFASGNGGGTFDDFGI